jgi:NAD(P)-dependent dehydrogenase (short-subunit alcohol dehydrogenase family)
VGFASCKVIASSSPNVHVLLACRSISKAEAAISTLKSLGVPGSLTPLQLDVTSEDSISSASAFVEKTFGRLDVLVNNAGVANGDPDLRTRHKLCFEINLLGPVLVAKAFRPLLLRSENPYSVYVSSVVGSTTLAADPKSPTFRGPPNGEMYRASKAALNMMVLQEVASRKEGDPVKLFVVCPGFVRSNLAGEGTEATKARNSRAGDPEDSGRLILSVLSGERDLHEGKFIHTDGVYPW